MLKFNKLEFIFSRIKVIALGLLIVMATSVISYGIWGKTFEIFWTLFSWLLYNISSVMLGWILSLLLLVICLFVSFMTLFLFICGIKIFIRSFSGSLNIWGK